MRRLLLIFALSLFAASCSKEYVTDGFTFDKRVYEVSCDGGIVLVDFAINGKIRPPHVVCYDPWLEIETLSATELKLRADKNFGAEREAHVYFTNPNTGDNSSIIVRQKAYDGKRAIELSVSNLTSRTCDLTAKSKSKNDDMLIVIHVNNYVEFQDYADSPQFFVSDIMRSYANKAWEADMSLVDYLEMINRGGYGTVQYHFDKLIPGDVFNLCAFGITYDAQSNTYELITPLYYKAFDVPTQPKRDIELVESLDINGADLSMTFDPGAWDGYYHYQIVSHLSHSSIYFPPSEQLTEQIHRGWALELYEDYYYRVMVDGISLDEFMAEYCLKGPQEVDLTLLAEEDYLLVAYAVDIVEGIPQIVSKIDYRHFRTGSVEPVDLTVDFQINELYGRLLRYELIPSNDTDSYVSGVMKKADFDVIPESTLVGMLTQDVDPINGVKYGRHSGEITLLEPETEYVVCIVGSHGGMVTTDLMYYTFTTKAAEPCSVSVKDIKHNGPYSLRDLHESGSEYSSPDWKYLESRGYTMIWYEIETEGEPYKIFSHVYATQDIEEYTPERAYNHLLTMQSDKLLIYNVFYLEEISVWCVLMDEKGNLSELYKSEPFTLHIEDKRDINELLEILERLMGLTRSNNRVIGDGTVLANDELSVDKPLVRIL